MFIPVYCVYNMKVPLHPQILKEPPPGSFDTLAPTVACPPGGHSEGAGGTEVELAQLRQFTFASELQRMSVLVSDNLFPYFIFPCSHSQVRVAPSSDPKQLHIYCKGAPETVRQLCTPDTGTLHGLIWPRLTVDVYTSVPGDFQEVLGSLTQCGYRVLAVGHRPLHMAWHKAERVKRCVHFSGSGVMSSTCCGV